MVVVDNVKEVTWLGLNILDLIDSLSLGTALLYSQLRGDLDLLYSNLTYCTATRKIGNNDNCS